MAITKKFLMAATGAAFIVLERVAAAHAFSFSLIEFTPKVADSLGCAGFSPCDIYSYAIDLAPKELLEVNSGDTLLVEGIAPPQVGLGSINRTTAPVEPSDVSLLDEFDREREDGVSFPSSSSFAIQALRSFSLVADNAGEPDISGLFLIYDSERTRPESINWSFQGSNGRTVGPVPIPEPSSALAIMVSSAFSVSCLLRRKHKRQSTSHISNPD